MRGQFGRIGRSIRLIHAGYAQPLDVTQLAEEAGMSIPSFHSHFKAVTQVSPMQYVKSTRLHQARLLMVRQDLSAERSEEHTSELQSLMRISYAVFCLKKKNNKIIYRA